MKKKKPKGRGGPGRNQGRKAVDGCDVKRVNVMLDDKTIDKARDIGEGNLSAGIRKAVMVH